MVLWTCDKCHVQETRMAEHSAPAAWRRVITTDIDGRETKRSQADWCGPCCRKYLEPLAQAQGDADD